MKVIHLVFSSAGGASAAARRSVLALRMSGVQAELWTGDGSAFGPALSTPSRMRWRARLDRLKLRLYPRRRIFAAWSSNWLPSNLAPRINSARPDLVHLHWLGHGFLSLTELERIAAPMVWTMHDAWAFTGGCHCPAECVRYRQDCGACPQLGSMHENDLSRRNLKMKRAHLGRVAAWISPSQWLAEMARESGTIEPARVHVIPNAVDGDVFCPRERMAARRMLGLPEEATLLVAGAMDLSEPHKGCQLLPEAMAHVVAGWPRPIVLAMFGDNKNGKDESWPCPIHWLGRLQTEQEVAAVLGAADVCLLPSLQDNLPNIAVEAQACGCPVVGFDAGGLKEIIEPGHTGWLAESLQAKDLGQAVLHWLRTTPATDVVQVRCRDQYLSKFTPAVHGQELGRLYDKLLSTGR